MDFSQPFGELKFVENIFPQAGEVFGGETKTYACLLYTSRCV